MTVFCLGKLQRRNVVIIIPFLVCMKELLDRNINLQKSNVVFCRNVHPDVKANLGTILGVQCVEEHDRYLGLPLHIG